MGIDVDKTIANTFALGGAAAGLAGILYLLLFPQAHFFMGFIPGLKAFTAAVLGGIGNVPGAFLGAMLLGLLESVGPSLFLDGMGIPAAYQLKDAIAFTILVFHPDLPPHRYPRRAVDTGQGLRRQDHAKFSLLHPGNRQFNTV